MKRMIGCGAGLALGALIAAAALAENEHETPAQLVGDLRGAFGQHHARAVHAKGVILDGEFVPTPEARALSSAALFAGGAVPVTARFSDFTGIPDIADTADAANPRGFAIKFKPAAAPGMDIVTHSFNGFPTANADEFGQLLRAIAASGPTAPKPTALDQYLSSHPIAKKFLTTQKPAPVSYATLSYFGVNSFRFVDANKKPTNVRYRLVPKAGEHFLDAKDLQARGPNYLAEEIAARAAGGIEFDWFAQIAEAGDKIADPSIAWPETRKLVKLGTVRLTRMTANPAAADKSLLFLPAGVPPGIETADPMLEVRSAAYPVSFGARQ